MKKCITVAAIFLTMLVAAGAWAQSPITIDVKTVLASKGKAYIDPRLTRVARELKSVFNYSSYELLSENGMRKRMGETGTIALPGKRVLQITPMEIKGKRVKLKLVILNKKRKDFQTVIQLLNRSRLTVGGPQYKGGYLLFNIACSF